MKRAIVWILISFGFISLNSIKFCVNLDAGKTTWAGLFLAQALGWTTALLLWVFRLRDERQKKEKE